MPRFYCAMPFSVGQSVELPDRVAHHMHVLRLVPGNLIVLFNGDGNEYVAAVSSISKKSAFAEIKTISSQDTELPYAVTLAQALPEAAKMDWIVEKAVELGAAVFQPLAAQRCVVKLSQERAEKKVSHWQGIIVAACEQCGRNRIPLLAEPADFGNWITQHDMHLRIMLTPRAEQSLSSWARHHPPQAVTLLVGPEGGFTEQEENAARANNVLPLSMGPRVLRTETAGLAALAALNAVWDSM